MILLKTRENLYASFYIVYRAKISRQLEYKIISSYNTYEKTYDKMDVCNALNISCTSCSLKALTCRSSGIRSSTFTIQGCSILKSP